MSDDEITAEVERLVRLMEHAERCRWEHAQPPTPRAEALRRIDRIRARLTTPDEEARTA